MYWYIGIDPGAAGGIAVISPDLIVAVYPYTSTKLIEVCNKIKTDTRDVKIAVEQVHAMPKQGVTSMFTFGANFGKILGILEAFEFEYELVSPRSWKHAMKVTGDKKTSIAKAQELFPDVSLLPTPRSRVPHDGLAEALLICEYFRHVVPVKSEGVKRRYA